MTKLRSYAWPNDSCESAKQTTALRQSPQSLEILQAPAKTAAFQSGYTTELCDGQYFILQAPAFRCSELGGMARAFASEDQRMSSTSAFSMLVVARSPVSLTRDVRGCSFFHLPLLSHVPEDSMLFFTSLAKFSSSSLAFLILSLHSQAISL